LQLARISSVLMALAGVKQPRKSTKSGAPSPTISDLTDDERGVLSALPERALPKRLTPDEYLAMRASSNG
jgi:hypothetical protein